MLLVLTPSASIQALGCGFHLATAVPSVFWSQGAPPAYWMVYSCFLAVFGTCPYSLKPHSLHGCKEGDEAKMGAPLPCVQPTFLIKCFLRKTQSFCSLSLEGICFRTVTGWLQVFHKEAVHFFLLWLGFLNRSSFFFPPPGSTGMCLETFELSTPERVHY